MIKKFFFPSALLASFLFAEAVLSRPLDLDLSLRRQGKETYNQFLQRANNLAQKTIEQRFRTDSSLDALNVVVIGENQGAIAPVLSVKVNRDGWNSNPDVQRWSRVFPFSKSLLDFESAPASASPAPRPPEPSPAPPTPQPEPSPELLPLDDLPPPVTEDPRPIPEQRLQPRRSQM